MCEIAKALSATELEFAQEAFEVFARDLDDLAAEMYAAQHDDAKAWFDSEFGPPRHSRAGV
jgi:hypothetical protein